MSNEQLVQQLLIILTALIASQGFWNLLSSKLSKTSKIEKAVRSLLHDRLSYLTEKYINAGCISPEEYRVVTELYEAYCDVGGNGTITRLISAVQQLKIETKEY